MALPDDSLTGTARVIAWYRANESQWRARLTEAGWTGEQVAVLDAGIERWAGLVDPPMQAHELAVTLTGRGVPVEEATRWVHTMLRYRPNALSVAGVPRRVEEVAAYESAAGGDRELARAGWAAWIAVPELATMAATGPVDLDGLWLMAGLAGERDRRGLPRPE